MWFLIDSLIFRLESYHDFSEPITVIMEDLDSTKALLDSTIPTPTIVDSIAQDSEEDEIFFGQMSDKEKLKGKKFKR